MGDVEDGVDGEMWVRISSIFKFMAWMVSPKRARTLVSWGGGLAVEAMRAPNDRDERVLVFEEPGTSNKYYGRREE